MNKDAALAVTIARTRLLISHPFFGSLATRFEMLECPKTRTMSVSKRIIRYNPEFVLNNSAGLNQAVVAHEVMHPVFDHLNPDRINGRDPKKWNQAGDYVINWELTRAGFDFEGTGLLDKKYAGMTTERVYSMLPDQGTGDPLDDLIIGPDGGDDEDGESSSEADAAEWKIAVIQAANAAKAVGKLPASLERFITQLTAPKVDWRTVLQRFITETSRDDYSWMHSNKRYVSYDLYIPTLHSESMGEIVVAIDTSGSITNDVLNAFGSEIQAIVGMARPSKTTVIYCDAEVNHVDTFDPGDEMHFKLHGGGGTAFKPVMDYIDEHGIRPVCLVYLTDLYGPHNFAPPEYPVMWCCTTDQTATFGQTIKLEL